MALIELLPASLPPIRVEYQVVTANIQGHFRPILRRLALLAFSGCPLPLPAVHLLLHRDLQRLIVIVSNRRRKLLAVRSMSLARRRLPAIF